MLHFEQLYGITLVSVNPKKNYFTFIFTDEIFATGKTE